MILWTTGADAPELGGPTPQSAVGSSTDQPWRDLLQPQPQ